MEAIKCDVVIVGSGVAGLVSALTLDRKNDILLITKKELRDSNSYLAQGGICLRHGLEDREDFIEDTMAAGHYKNNKKAVEILVDESEDAIKSLIDFGVEFTGDENGIFYTREGGHSKNRIAYCQDATGKAIMEALIKEVLRRDNIKIIENCQVKDLLESDNKCIGVYASKDNKDLLINSKATVLATGGLGGIYKNTTNYHHIRGDGISLAIRHKVKLKDISYVQIHPTSFYEDNKERRFLISESVRGEGALLKNQKGERFVDELKTRDIVTKAIFEEMDKDKSSFEFLDFKSINQDIKDRFPNIYAYLKDKELDPYKELIPIVPAEHYTMGGIEVDMDSKTSLENLYAVGEVACTGVHGANRLASNSLLESVVFAKRLAKSLGLARLDFTDYSNNIRKIRQIDDEESKKLIIQRIEEDEIKKIEEFSN
ncbi:MAG: L-aspartate oxidase [Peptoniphilaceae bacterium]